MSRATDLQARLGRVIYLRRKRMNLTQEMFAERVGRSTGTISKLESGWVNPSLDTIRRVAEALDAPISSLFDDVEKLERLDAEGS